MKLLAKLCYFAKKRILSSGSNSGPLSLGPLIFGSSLGEWTPPESLQFTKEALEILNGCLI